MEENIYDLIGIGIGPFNLGLAALSFGIPELRCLFLDSSAGFDWHPGLLIDGSRLQVPFYRDLVTLADPSSPFSYLSFLKAHNRMFRFAIHENYFITRKEFNQYAQWVAGQIPYLSFRERCVSIAKENGVYCVSTNIATYRARHIVIGTGTVPAVPSFVVPDNLVFHSSDYLLKRESLLKRSSVAVIGSGQSAAEVFYDLLQRRSQFPAGLYWYTRSPRFFPMDYSKLTLELSTPDYINHFFSLSAEIRSAVFKRQDMLYKGVNHSLLAAIYDLLYSQSIDGFSNPVILQANCELRGISSMESGLGFEDGANRYRLDFYHSEIEKEFCQEVDSVVLATGYKYVLPSFIEPIQELIHFDDLGNYAARRNYSLDDENTIFIQNAEQSTHGFNAADLSLGPYRNAVILNTILGYEKFVIEKNVVFQKFGV